MGDKHMVTVVEAAAKLGITRNTVSNIAARNNIAISRGRIVKRETVARRVNIMQVDLNALKAAMKKEEGEDGE